MHDVRQLALFNMILKLTAGMPLCVILAARRLTGHGESPETLLKEAADDLMRIMEAPELKHLPERLRSLKASLELSYRHLSDSAQELFARMSFFPGGISRKRDDLWELVGDDWDDAAEELARYALARYDRPEQRYTMLNPVMEYAREKLDAGEGNEFRRSAVEYWAEFARWHGLMMDVRPAAQESAAKLLSLPDEPEEREMVRSESFAMLAMDEDNIVYAAEWALRAGDEVGIGIVDALEDYLRLSAGWYTQEQLYLLALALRRQLAESDPEEYTPDVAGTLNNLGVLLRNMGDPDAALKHYAEALEIRRKLSESHPDAYMPDVAATLNNIGVLLRNMGDPDAALKHYEEALEIRRKLSESHPDAYMPNVAMTLNNLGVLLDDMGDPDAALKHYEEALEIRRKFYQRYPSAYARDLLQTLRNATEVYEKLKMKKRAAECRREMEEITGKLEEE
jgi:tetratricopeptide (TPR) repeat protein